MRLTAVMRPNQPTTNFSRGSRGAGELGGLRRSGRAARARCRGARPRTSPPARRRARRARRAPRAHRDQPIRRTREDRLDRPEQQRPGGAEVPAQDVPVKRVHDDRAARAREQRRGASDRAGLGRVRVHDVGSHLRMRRARRRPRARPRPGTAPGEPREGDDLDAGASATNAIDASPSATSPATSVVSYPRSARPRARYVTWSAGPPTLSRAITRRTRIGRPFARSLIRARLDDRRGRATLARCSR